MTNLPLSPAAKAVLDAALPVYNDLYVFTDKKHAGMIAAALRAVDEQLGESRAPGLEPEDLYGRIIDVDDLLAIAAELEAL